MGAGEIDSLEIKIQANAQKANQSLDALVGKLERLSTSLGKVNGNSLASLSNGVQRLSSSMQSMKNIGTADFTRLAKNIQKMGQLDSKQLGKAAGSIRRFANSLGSLDKISVSDNAAQIGELANGIKQLGYKSSTQAIGNIPKLATAMRQLMAELSKAPKVSRNVIDMTNAMAKFARTGASGGRAANSLAKSFNTFSASSNRASKSSFSLAGAIGKLYASYWLIFRGFGKVRDAINISSDLTEVQNVVDVTFGKYSKLVDKMAKTSIPQFGMSELTVKKISSRYQAMGTAMGFAQGKMADMSIELTKLAADMASFYNMEQTDVAEDLESIFTGMTRPLRTYGLDLTEATLKEWAMKNGLDANIDSMTQAQKTMLRYQYVLANTGAAQGDFARTSGTWANQTRILKQNFEQLASVIGGIGINAFKPFVSSMNIAIGKVTDFAKVISDALGQIFGWTYEEGGGVANDFGDAADSAEDIADATGQAAKNTAKIAANLQSFDRLNVVTKDTSSKGNGGSGVDGIGTSGADGGRWVQKETIFKNITSDIKTLEQLGETIGKSLTNAMGNIDWDSVYKKAGGFGSGLASFLNGLFKSDKNGNNVFSGLGGTIAGGLNTAVNSALGFAQEFDFKQFGKNFASGFNKFFNDFDFKSLATSLNVWVDGLVDAFASFISNITWEDILKGAGDFLGELELDTVAVLIGAFLFKHKGKELTAAILSTQLAQKILPVGKDIFLATGLTVGISLVSFRLAKSISYSFAEWYNKKYGDKYGKIDTSNEITFTETIQGGIELSFGDSGEIRLLGLDNLHKLFPENKIIEIINADLSGATQKAIEKLSFDGFWDAFTKGATNSPEKEKFWKAFFKGFEQDNIINIKDTLEKKWEEARLWWEKDKNPLKGYTYRLALPSIKKFLKERWENAKSWWDNAKKPLSMIRWGVVIPSIKTAISERWDSAKEWWDKKKSSLKKISFSVDSIKSKVKDKWDSFKRWWSGLKISFPKIKIPKFKIDGEFSLSPPSVPKISLEYPQYATGGFPEDGLFMANHGELVGQFSNGKTAVVNNEQIIQGVSIGVADAVSKVLSPYLQSGQSVNVVLAGDAGRFLSVVHEEENKQKIRTGKYGPTR